MSNDKPLVLLVDDESQVTDGLKLQIRKEFNVHTADSGKAGLEFLKENDRVAVIVSDMRMPEMDGAEFLSRSIELAPDATRLLLTGQTDLESAIQAINEGRIFRFLTKPCDRDTFRNAMADALRQHLLVVAERDILERTLRGAVEVLTELLGVLQPKAARRSHRLLDVVRQVTAALGLPLDWRTEVGAMLSHVGCIGMPEEVLEQVFSGAPLKKEERKLFSQHPDLASQWVSTVPRLESVAEAIQAAGGWDPMPTPSGDPNQWPEEELRVLLLRLGFEYLEKFAVHDTEYDAKVAVVKESGLPKALLRGLGKVRLADRQRERALVQTRKLEYGMVLCEPLRSNEGVFLAPEGARVSASLVKLAQNYSKRGLVPDEIRVWLAPPEDEEESASNAA